MFRKMASLDIEKAKKMLIESKESITPEMTGKVHVGMNNNEVPDKLDQIEAATMFEARHADTPVLCRVVQFSENLNSAEHCQLENNGTSKKHTVENKGESVGDGIDNVTDGNAGLKDTNASDGLHFTSNKDNGMQLYNSTQGSHSNEGIVWNVHEKHTSFLAKNVVPKNTGKDANEVHENNEIKLPKQNMNKTLHDNGVDHHDKVQHSHSCEIEAKSVREKCANLEGSLRRLTFDEREASAIGHHGDHRGMYSDPTVGLERHQLQPLLEDMVSRNNKMSRVMRKPDIAYVKTKPQTSFAVNAKDQCLCLR